jgi:peptide deformylase
MLRIINAPNEILSQKSQTVEKVDKEILNLIDQMKETLLAAKDPEGVGLAAPQVGKPLSIFLMKPSPKTPIKVIINPVIISEENGTEKPKKSGPTKLEGCLSLPNIWGEVTRKSSLTLSFMDEKGVSYTKIFRGFIATIIQHETDHLNGTLFTERVLEQEGTLYKSHKDEKGEDVFEEIEL